MEFQQEPLIINLIKSLTQVHDYNISLTTLLVKSGIKVLCELNQLCFEASPAPEAMLILEENVISVLMGHNLQHTQARDIGR